MSMFGDIFDDLKTSLTSGGDFWDAAIAVAGPTAKELLSSKGKSGGSTPENKSLDALSAYGKADIKERSTTYEAAEAVDPAEVRKEYIERMRAYALGEEY